MAILIPLAWVLPQPESAAPPASRTYSPPVEPPALEIEAVQLAAEFESNEIRAQQDYKAKRLKVRGQITGIGLDLFGGPYFILDRKVQVGFSSSDKERLARFDKGQIITARCESPSKLVYVVMTGCLF